MGSLISGTLTVLATASLLSTLKKWASERAKSASTASSVASAINVTLVSPCTSPPTAADKEKVLNALGELQLQLSADLSPSDIPITDAQCSVALLDALDGDTRLWVRTLLRQSQEVGDPSSLLNLVAAAVAAPGSKSTTIFKMFQSKGLTSDLESHIEAFAVKAASFGLPVEVAVAMFCHSLDPASASKEAWDPAPGSLEKAFGLACCLSALPAYTPKQGIMASFPVVKNPPAKAPQKPAKSQGGISVLCPNWPTTSGSVSEFAAPANIPDVASGEPSGSILSMQNKEDLSYFLLNATFYTHTRKAKVTVLIDTGVAGNFMNHTLARSMDLTCLGPKELLGVSKVQVTAYPVSKPPSYCTGNYVFVSRFLAVNDLLFPVILGVGWWRRHQVHIDGPENELHFSLDNSAGVLFLPKPGVEPPKSCLSLKASPEVPSLVLIPGILTPYQDAFDLSLATALF
ncbi:hypothetical protein DSO57_1020414 [Entomophthora muscae]|uniref:Uncharacterized protein n=1 Tax=Entomophthora muscae TaxID=34485 RepID=A0ACC2S5L6_9FUNG|nr:hypothetical protein DSO57_1020414 [Entomophthora muscae]